MVMRKSKKAVSPVIATILMVAITVVLAAVLYVMVMGMTGNQQQLPKTVALSAQSYSGTTTSVTVLRISNGDVALKTMSWKIVTKTGGNSAQTATAIFYPSGVGTSPYYTTANLTSATGNLAPNAQWSFTFDTNDGQFVLTDSSGQLGSANLG